MYRIAGAGKTGYEPLRSFERCLSLDASTLTGWSLRSGAKVMRYGVDL